MHALAGSSSQKQIGHVIADRGRVQWSPDEEVEKEEPASAGAVVDEPARRSSRRCRVLLREAVSSSSTSSLSSSEMTTRCACFDMAHERKGLRCEKASGPKRHVADIGANSSLLVRLRTTGFSLLIAPFSIRQPPLPCCMRATGKPGDAAAPVARAAASNAPPRGTRGPPSDAVSGAVPLATEVKRRIRVNRRTSALFPLRLMLCASPSAAGRSARARVPRACGLRAHHAAAQE